MKVLLVIRSLKVGGAERQVVTMAKSLADAGLTVHIAIFETGGTLEAELNGFDAIKLHVLSRPRIIGLLSLALQIRRLVRTNKYDAVYGFLPIPNLTLLGARFMRHRPRIIWGVRSSNLDLDQYSQKVRWSMKIERFMSRWADAVVSNSYAARIEYIELGYQADKFEVIHNVVDVERFKPRPDIKESLKQELGLPVDSPVIGLFARIHHKKDHKTLLKAAAIALVTHSDLHLLCVGGHSPTDTAYVEQQKSLATELGIADRVHWLGERSDPELLMNACTITTLSSSSGEGFPNSVAESLACGIPCVTTDSGDAGLIVDDDRFLVPPNDPDALARAWSNLLNMRGAELALLAPVLRSSIVDRFSPGVITEKICSVLEAS